MSQAKHTPGPWYLGNNDKKQQWNNNGGFALDIDSTFVDSVASVWCKEEKESEEELANANLIAAAPDLLEQCEISLENIESGKIFYNDEEREQTINQLKSVIKKAKGL